MNEEIRTMATIYAAQNAGNPDGFYYSITAPGHFAAVAFVAFIVLIGVVLFIFDIFSPKE